MLFKKTISDVEKINKLSKKYRIVYNDNKKAMLCGEATGFTYSNKNVYETNNYNEFLEEVKRLGLTYENNQDFQKKEDEMIDSFSLKNIEVDLSFLNYESYEKASVFKEKSKRPDFLNVKKSKKKYITEEQYILIGLLLNNVITYKCKVQK